MRADASNLQDSQRLCVHLMDRALERLESANASSQGQEVRLPVQRFTCWLSSLLEVWAGVCYVYVCSSGMPPCQAWLLRRVLWLALT